MGIYNLGGGGGAPELQAKEATPLITNAQQIILPDEGYDGLSKVTVNPMPTGTLKTPTVNSIGYVSSGVQTAGYLNTSATSGLQLSTQAAKTITPTTYSQTAVASGRYTTGNVTVAGDANLVSGNIVAGKSIFGVSGSHKDPITAVSSLGGSSFSISSDGRTLTINASVMNTFGTVFSIYLDTSGIGSGVIQKTSLLCEGFQCNTGWYKDLSNQLTSSYVDNIQRAYGLGYRITYTISGTLTIVPNSSSYTFPTYLGNYSGSIVGLTKV